MEKEFIPYEQALALKELGFDEDCFGWYNWTGKDLSLTNNSYVDINPTPAPLFSQAFRWFREKYSLDSNIYLYLTSNGLKNDMYYEEKYYKYYIRKSFRSPFRLESENYKTYEEAELKCLKKLIEIVNNK